MAINFDMNGNPTGGTFNMPATSGMLPMGQAWAYQPPASYFPGQTIAGFTPTQQSAWEAQQQGAADVYNLAQNLTNTGFTDTSSSYSYSGPGQYEAPQMDYFNNPYLDQTVESTLNDITNQFNENVLPQLKTTFADQPGSLRQGLAQGRATEGLLRQLANTSSSLRSNAYNTGINAFLQDMATQLGAGTSVSSSQSSGLNTGAINAAMQGFMAPGQTLENIGSKQQLFNQMQLNALKDRWDWEQNKVGDKLGQLISMYTGTGAGTYGKSEGSGKASKF